MTDIGFPLFMVCAVGIPWLLDVIAAPRRIYTLVGLAILGAVAWCWFRGMPRLDVPDPYGAFAFYALLLLVMAFGIHTMLIGFKRSLAGPSGTSANAKAASPIAIADVGGSA